MIFDSITRFLIEVWSLLLVVSPWLLLGLFVAGLIHAFIGEDLIKHHLGGSGVVPVIKSTLFGIPLPVCSCGVIPIAAGIRKDGASKAATMAFMTSTPTTGVDSIFVTYAFLGLTFAIARPLAALIGGLLIGTLVHALEYEPAVVAKKHGTHPKLNFGQQFRESITYGFSTLPQDIGRTLLIGIVVGGAITMLIPRDIAQDYLSNPLVAYPLMLIISVPIYVCAVGSVPIAAALLMKGLVPGAALAFLIAGPATNTITLAFVGKEMGKKVLVSYLTSIVLCAIISGLLLDFFVKDSDFTRLATASERAPYLIQIIAAIGLLLIIIFNIRAEDREEIDMEYTFRVPDMTCKHCKMTIEQALRDVPNVEKVEVFLGKKIVAVSGDVDPEDIKRRIEEAGYHVAKRSE